MILFNKVEYSNEKVALYINYILLSSGADPGVKCKTEPPEGAEKKLDNGAPPLLKIPGSGPGLLNCQLFPMSYENYNFRKRQLVVLNWTKYIKYILYHTHRYIYSYS